MKTRLFLIASIVVLTGFIIGIGYAPSAFAETRPREILGPASLNQEGNLNEEWEKFLQQTRAWLEQLALLFAQAPVIGLIIAEILKILGPAYVWCVGAVIVMLILGGLFAVGRR